jgi:uncharacterized protein YuzE
MKGKRLTVLAGRAMLTLKESQKRKVESMIAESKVRYDARADVLHLVCDWGEIARSVEVSPGITGEFGDAGNILGAEILRASKVLTEKVIASLHAQQAGVL